MPFKDSKKTLLDILDNILLGTSFIQNLTYEEFVEDKRTIYATIRALEIISEAVRRLPDEIFNHYTDVPWKNI